MLNAAGIKLVVHHGIIREDASDNTEVKLDVPLGTDSIIGLNGSKYALYLHQSWYITSLALLMGHDSADTLLINLLIIDPEKMWMRKTVS